MGHVLLSSLTTGINDYCISGPLVVSSLRIVNFTSTFKSQLSFHVEVISAVCLWVTLDKIVLCSLPICLFPFAPIGWHQYEDSQGHLPDCYTSGKNNVVPMCMLHLLWHENKTHTCIFKTIQMKEMSSKRRV